MVRTLVKTVLLVIVLVGAAAFLLGWWGSGQLRSTQDGATRPDVSVGTGANSQRAREVGAKVGERTAAAADQAQRAMRNGSVTAKIKSKMVLDDAVSALDINVDTDGGTVTVSGVVRSAAQRDRVLQLARETDGVTQVVDRLRVED